MADNVAVTAGSGTSIAADEVVDGTLGTVKVQYVKVKSGVLDNTNKLVVDTHGSAQTTLVDSSGTAVTFNANQTGDYAKSVGAAPVILPQDQVITVKASTVTNGTTKTRVVSAASTNATSVK